MLKIILQSSLAIYTTLWLSRLSYIWRNIHYYLGVFHFKICIRLAKIFKLKGSNYRYVQAFVSSQLVGRKGNFWIGLTQSYDTGITEQWTSGQEVRFTYWADEHTGASSNINIHEIEINNKQCKVLKSFCNMVGSNYVLLMILSCCKF